MKRTWLHYASPATFAPLARRLIGPAAWLSAALAVAGVAVALFLAPIDAVQRDAYRIIYVHVPAAWMSMLIYLAMALYAALHLVFNARLSALMVRALAPTGALFTALALVTGALWGRPTWGTYWVWDARLTSELVLLFLYAGVLLLQRAIPDAQRADRAGSFVVLVGVVNIPIIYFSVVWWNTLHQGASISLSRAPTMAGMMLAGLLLMTASAWLYTIAVSLTRLLGLIALRARDGSVAAASRARWVGAADHTAHYTPPGVSS